MDNQRHTYRVEPDDEISAELRHGPRIMSCTLVNLSAGGAKVLVRMALPYEARCELVLKLSPQLREKLHVDVVEVPMRILESVSLRGAMQVRLHSLVEPGSPTYERVSHVVFELHRRARARESGADEATPMSFDSARRRKLRRASLLRFGRKSLRPDLD